MPIEFWIGLWQVVLVAGIVLFTTLAVVVTIGGAIDVRKLFRTLKEQHAEEQDSDPDAPSQ